MGAFWLLAPPTAAAYAAVGLGGASGYLALGLVLDLEPATLRVQALWLNLLVAGLSLLVRLRARQLEPDLALPILATSAPAAFLAAWLTADPPAPWRFFVGAVLAGCGAASLLARPAERRARSARSPLRLGLIGAGIGALSGTTGIGGGVLLAPLLLHRGLGDERAVGAVTTLFVLANSSAALAGLGAPAVSSVPPLLGSAAVAGGALLGAWTGASLARPALLRRLLGAALVVAGLRPLLTP